MHYSKNSFFVLLAINECGYHKIIYFVFITFFCDYLIDHVIYITVYVSTAHYLKNEKKLNKITETKPEANPAPEKTVFQLK